MNCELPDVQAGFRKGRGTKYKIANIHWIIKKAREFQKNIYFCFIDYAKTFDCVYDNKLWKILQEIGIPDHLICLLRNLYAAKKQQLELDTEKQAGSKLGNEYCQGPAPADPGYSKERRHRRPIYLNIHQRYKE